MDSISNRDDNSIAYLDGVDSALREVLKERQILNDTLIISTAAHDEALGEHGYKGHVHTFFEEEAHVPMWIHLPNSLLQYPTLLKTLQPNKQWAPSLGLWLASELRAWFIRYISIIKPIKQ